MSRLKRSRRRQALVGGLAGVAMLGAAGGAWAQVPVKINSIAITNVGPLNVSEALVRANIRVKSGDPYNRAAIDDDVRNLYSTGHFENIRVIEDRQEQGLALTYVLVGKVKITDILFTGNEKYSTAKLMKKLSSKIGEPLDQRKLFADSQEIRKLYQKAGQQKTEVKTRISSDERSGRGTVTFEIIEAPKIKVEEVHFDGARAFSQGKLRRVVKTRPAWMFSWITRNHILKDEKIEEDKDRLTEFYRKEGYIDFELKDLRFEPESPRKMRLVWVINEGTPYKIGAVDFKGVTLFPTNDLLKKLKMPVGSTFTPGGLDKDVEMLRDTYGAKGYIDVRVVPLKKPNTQTGTMDLVYEFEEGGQAFIEKVEIRGNVKTKDKVVRRELAVSPGERFDMVKVKLSKKRLENLTYFERVEAVPEPTDIPDRRNLVVTVAEGTTGHFSIGAGFNTVDSVVGTVEMTQGNFDLFNPPWFTGGGQKLRLRLSYGFVLQNYQITFVEPWLFGKKLSLTTDLYHTDYNNVSVNDLYSERRTGARLGLARALGSDFLIGGVSYTLENVTIYDIDQEEASYEIQREEGSRLVSQVGLSLTYDTRNSATLPSRGQRTEFRPSVAGGPFGADSDFYRLELRHARYFRGFAEGHIIELIARVGVVEAYDDTDRVPLFDRWFLGGIHSLRGYRYREIGPRDYTSEPIGGGTYWFATAEYSIPIIERVRFAFFYDIGMVYRKAYSFDTSYSYDAIYNGQVLQLSDETKFFNDNVGVGLRLNLPIGPLRLDYGIPITHDERLGSSGRFQFSVGYTRDF